MQSQVYSTPQTAADTTSEGQNLAGEAVNQFGNQFAEGFRLFRAGEWEALYNHIVDGAFQLFGILTQQGLQALAALILLLLIYRLIYFTLHSALENADSIDLGLQNLIQRSFRVVAYFFIGTVVLDQLGLDVTLLLGGLGIAGVIAGFAARDSLENFISGVTILVDKPFRVGDYVKIDDEYGRVDEITLRSTRIRTVRNRIMVLPNFDMITQRITNHTKRNILRIDIPFGTAYKERPDEARQVLLPLVDDDDRVLSEPSPSVVVTEMSDSSVDMAFRFFTHTPSDEVPIRWEYTEKVREALREADIEIPFPHRQLFLDEAKAFQGTTLQSSSNGTDSAAE